jgi:CRP-like cAMP-binding protein
MKALAAEQDERYQSVSELRQAVELFIREGGWFSVELFAPGQDIVREGELGQRAYIIDQGTCEVWHTVDGDKRVARELGPGEPFGETALFSDMPRTATVTALTAVRVAVITRENLDRELRNHVWLRSLIKAVATRFVETDRELRSRHRKG